MACRHFLSIGVSSASQGGCCQGIVFVSSFGSQSAVTMRTALALLSLLAACASTFVLADDQDPTQSLPSVKDLSERRA